MLENEKIVIVQGSFSSNPLPREATQVFALAVSALPISNQTTRGHLR